MDSVKERLKKISLLVLDFDGVFTDNRVWMDGTGREMVACDRSDSLGLKMLREQRPDIKVFVISKETNEVVRARCDKLGIPALIGIDDKAKALRALISSVEGGVAFIGNDLNDLDCIRIAGVGIAVADAIFEVRKEADYITIHRGGHGAIREITDMILGA